MKIGKYDIVRVIWVIKTWWYGRIRGICPICRFEICSEYPRPGLKPIFKRIEK